MKKDVFLVLKGASMTSVLVCKCQVHAVDQ